MRRALIATLLLSSCAHVPAGRYGIESLEIEGMEEMDERALRSCLGSRERDTTGLDLGAFTSPSCGEPPFDDSAYSLELWSWPWVEWPLFDPTLFRRDLERVERWYAARGFHDARVVRTEVSPEAALEGDDPSCEEDECEVTVRIVVEEGAPTQLVGATLHGHEDLDPEVREELEAIIRTDTPRRYDEWLLDEWQREIREALGERGFALAEAVVVARVDRAAKEARFDVSVDTGPRCQFGETRVEGADDGTEARIAAAAAIPRGERYDQSEIEDAQHAVFAMQAFSAVLVEPMLDEAREAEGCTVPVRVEVTPGRRHRYGVGVGVQSGVDRRGVGEEAIDVPQWDVHLDAHWEDQSFFGGLRRLRLEDRPRLIVQDRFPATTQPRFGNRATVSFRQPGFLEPRTDLLSSVQWDWGPDPFDTFFRHEVDVRLELERRFFDQRLTLTAGPRAHVFRVPDDEVRQNGEAPPSDSHLLYLHENLRLDLRDDGRRPRRGAYFEVDLQQAGYVPQISSWDYVRVVPEARGYLPLPGRITFALRFQVAALFITDADPALDEESRMLGPRAHRLRGGGANSHRGFLPGRLGDGPKGGTRRWLASAELRVPITESFSAATFADAGDVSSGGWRFDHPQIAVGLGLRYHTVVGALRLDVAGRISRAQTYGGDQRTSSANPTDVSFFGLFRFPGAVHITLGEAF